MKRTVIPIASYIEKKIYRVRLLEAVALIQLVRQPVKYPADYDAADKQGEKCMSLGSFLTIEIYGSLFLSPHSHMPSNMGMSDFPRSVRLYSTFGGICGYSFLL